MNTKRLKNWLRAALFLQTICEIEGCTRKAEYCLASWHGLDIRTCREHLGRAGEMEAMCGEGVK